MTPVIFDLNLLHPSPLPRFKGIVNSFCNKNSAQVYEEERLSFDYSSLLSLDLWGFNLRASVRIPDSPVSLLLPLPLLFYFPLMDRATERFSLFLFKFFFFFFFSFATRSIFTRGGGREKKVLPRDTRK